MLDNNTYRLIEISVKKNTVSTTLTKCLTQIISELREDILGSQVVSPPMFSRPII